MAKYAKSQNKSPFPYLASALIPIFIGWVGGKFLDSLYNKLVVFWTAAPDGFFFWLVVPLLLLAAVCCLLAAWPKSNQINELIALPDLNSGRHTDLLERLTNYSEQLSTPENVVATKKIVKELAVLTHITLGLFGAALGLMIFLAPRVLG